MPANMTVCQDASGYIFVVFWKTVKIKPCLHNNANLNHAKYSAKK